MIHINEWEEPDWITLEWDAIPPEPGAPPKRAPDGGAGQPPKLVDFICARLEALARSPSTVHFLEGEGLYWIRVGFAPGRTLRPEDVRRVGHAIASCAPTVPLYFHALRPRDMLFFFDGGKRGKVGMGAGSFGEPLPQVLQAWRLADA